MRTLTRPIGRDVLLALDNLSARFLPLPLCLAEHTGMVQNPPWIWETVPAPTRTTEMACHHVHEPEKSPTNARTRHPHLPRDKTRGYNPVATKKCVNPTTSARKVRNPRNTRASHTGGGYSTQTAQPVCNDLTAWRLNQGCFSIP